jgi:uncharacterized protein YchJ
MADQQVRSFNRSFPSIVTVLTSPVSIQEAFDPKVSQPLEPTKEYTAIWDTGATKTAITNKLAKECGLKPTGMCKVGTASGETDACTYLVSVYLPNKVCIPQLRVTEVKISGADVLIGMDIIADGDFAVTNHKGKTNMSFRMPSIECIDFVKREPTIIEVGGKKLNKVGRNELCPCGSGKKFKRCHGKVENS